MNKIYKNIIRYCLIFIAVFSINAFSEPEFNIGIIITLSFCIGFILSQSVKDIEGYFNKNLVKG